MVGSVRGAVTGESWDRIAAVTALSRSEAVKEPTVHVKGVITWLEFPNLVIQDESGGIWVHLREARRRGMIALDETLESELRFGTEVEVRGVCTPGAYMPVILPESLTVRGEKPVPSGDPIDPRQFFAGAESGRRVEIRGVVQTIEPFKGDWQLVVNSDFGQFPVRATSSTLQESAHLVDSEVRVRGVAGALFNGRGELIGPRLLCGVAGDIVVEKAAPPPEAVPLEPLDELMRYSPHVRLPHRVRVRGTVTLSVPGKYLYLQHENRAVRVETVATVSFNPGDEVEMAGFVEQRQFIAMLVGAEGHKIGQGSLPDPVTITPKQIIAINAQAKNRGLPARPHDFDGHLVRFPARLLAIQNEIEHRPGSQRLLLDSDGMILTADLADDVTRQFTSLQPGSVLQVTGIVQLEIPRKLLPTTQVHAQRLDVFLRDAADVVVLSKPGWWTPERLARIITVSGVLLLGVLIWVWQLRRQVSHKTDQLAVEMRARRDSAIEFEATMRERNRLAANLHDTLLQTMSGLTYQLEACESESLPRADRVSNHLDTARRMVQRGQEDLRGTVWALRVLPLKGRSLADALRAIVERMQDGYAVKISVGDTGAIPAVTEFVAGNLLLVAQEAINNALKHAEAVSINVALASTEDSGQLTLEVCDDGVGFSPRAHFVGISNHFGLLGMRERVERLGGEFNIESEVGRGTRVWARVPLRTFDAHLS